MRRKQIDEKQIFGVLVNIAETTVLYKSRHEREIENEP